MKPRVTGRCADRKSTAHFVPQHPPLETGCPLLACMLSHSVVSDSFAIPWTVVFQGPLPMEFSRQVYWNGFHFRLQGIFLTQESNPCLLCLLHWQMDSLSLSHLGSLRWDICNNQSDTSDYTRQKTEPNLTKSQNYYCVSNFRGHRWDCSKTGIGQRQKWYHHKYISLHLSSTLLVSVSGSKWRHLASPGQNRTWFPRCQHRAHLSLRRDVLDPVSIMDPSHRSGMWRHADEQTQASV